VVHSERVSRSLVVDLGCGDAGILLEAASHFSSRGLGFEIDEKALIEAMLNIQSECLGELISIRAINFMAVDLASEILKTISNGKVTEPTTFDNIVVTCFLLPPALQRLRPQLEVLVAKLAVTLITFQWDLDSRWQGPVPGEKDAEGRFTIYRPAVTREIHS
jgi:ribosomal protein L11 methylase PrmA